MTAIIDKTLHISVEYFKKLGFSEAQIEPILESGRRDMNNELNKLLATINDTPDDLEKINHSLHALKGLLFNLGNHDLANQLVEAREAFYSSGDVDVLRQLLFPGDQ